MRVFIILSIIIASIMSVKASEQVTNVRIIQTSDVHGNFFPYNYITRKPWGGSMARVAAYVNSLKRSDCATPVILLDNGDILQGQPSAYYYNFIDTASPHIASRIFDFMGYDAVTIGNHDVETGHKVYDRWIADTSIPVLGANVIDKASGKPYLTPYTVIERGGVKVAVLGLLTPAIPAWLPENLWSGLRFDDMEETARKWLPVIRANDNPDVIIGLFHSGRDASRMTGDYIENASYSVARDVPGFDIVLMGHDHRRFEEILTNTAGEKVVVLNPANNANAVADISITISKDSDGNIQKNIDGKIVDIDTLTPDGDFMTHFADVRDTISEFVSRKIGTSTGNFSTRDAFFGPSAFMDLIHQLQLEIGQAEISFAAPLSFDAEISEGDVTMSDMFTLYKYENLLYTMALTGREIKDYLEESYSIWTRQMASPDEHILLFNSDSTSPAFTSLKNPSYNFDSAYGIDYTVDVTKPKGEKINILALSDGRTFSPDSTYRVAINSYRGNGGGDLLTKGAGIPQHQLTGRIVASTDKDLRYYLMKAIEEKGRISPSVDGNWKFVPENYAVPASKRDYHLLFPTDSAKKHK